MMKNVIMHERLAINEHFPTIARYYDYEKFTYPWHFHSEYEIIYVQESSGERFVADSVEHFYPGDVILLGENVPHYMRSDEKYYAGNAEFRVKGVIIQFAYDYVSHAISKYADSNHVKLFLEESKRGIHFPYPANKEIIECIQEMPTYTGLERIIRLLLLLDKMAHFPFKRTLGSLYFNENLPLFSDNRIKKVLAYNMYHYTENIKLKEIASVASMNTSAFCRFFKEKTGKSYIEYIQDLRIGYACKLLIGTSYDISQISIECGFNTACHFNKLFKRNTGLTPSDYRKQFVKLKQLSDF
jgi:AraC-like DNA-binding protein